MCKIRARRWRSSFSPYRVIVALLSLALIVVGMLIQDLTGLVLLGLGSVALLTAVVFPVIRAVEFAFPSGLGLAGGLRNRERELRAAFHLQRGDLGLYSQLMCDDPALASALLEAAWAHAAAVWRGPATPALRSYVLCEFVHLLTAHSRWWAPAITHRSAPTGRDSPPSALSTLPLAARVSVVLWEFANLPMARIASLTGRPLAEVVSDLRSSDAALARFTASGDDT